MHFKVPCRIIIYQISSNCDLSSFQTMAFLVLESLCFSNKLKLKISRVENSQFLIHGKVPIIRTSFLKKVSM